MTTNNAVNTSLSGQTGIGAFVGSTTPTIVTPIIQQINDAFGNAVLELGATGSGVNSIFIQGSTTGNDPIISSTGSDINVSFKIAAQGSGQIVLETFNSTPFIIQSGTLYQHVSNFLFANTANTQNITFQDASGTVAYTSNIPSFPLSLVEGGTGASLTASNGGIFYSTASAGAILSGTTTAQQVLLSGSSSAPSWSTATYPSVTTVNQLLYSSSSNTIGGLATANNSVLVTDGSGVPSLGNTLPTQVQLNITELGTLVVPLSMSLPFVADPTSHWFFSGAGYLKPIDGANIYGIKLMPTIFPLANTSLVAGEYIKMTFSIASPIVATTAAGLYIDAISGGGGGSVTNGIGLYVENPLFGITRWSIKCIGYAEFDSFVGIGNYPNYPLDITSSTTNKILVNINGSVSPPSGGGPIIGLNVNPTLSPGITFTPAYTQLISPAFNTGPSVTIANAYGLYIGSMSNSGSGPITNSTSLYVSNPGVGTTVLCAEFAGIVKCDNFLGVGVIPTNPFHINISGSNHRLIRAEGSLTPSDGATVYGMEIVPTMSPSTNTSTVKTVSINNQLSIPLGVTVSNAVGLLIEPGSAGGSGTISTSWGLYVSLPAHGSNPICAEFTGRVNCDTNLMVGSGAVPSTQLHVYANNSSADSANGIVIEQAGTTNSVLRWKRGSQNWISGVDTVDSNAFKISVGNALNTTNAVRISTSGYINHPLQPSFTAGGSTGAVTGNGTTYTPLFPATTNVSASYNAATGTFTAPITGLYLFSAQLTLNGLTAAHSNCLAVFVVNASGFGIFQLNPGASRSLLSAAYSGAGSIITQLVAGDMVKLNVTVGGSTLTISLAGLFSGFLVG